MTPGDDRVRQRGCVRHDKRTVKCHVVAATAASVWHNEIVEVFHSACRRCRSVRPRCDAANGDGPRGSRRRDDGGRPGAGRGPAARDEIVVTALRMRPQHEQHQRHSKRNKRHPGRAHVPNQFQRHALGPVCACLSACNSSSSGVRRYSRLHYRERSAVEARD